ncbi:MAG: SRPBCC domain-containing protein [Pseudolysinimonas sp.]|uniref:SRPBCC domain-containing protein n=1 Tax=Pseudolysinimonas sp. TaxID=2680009 RepID=UPI003265C9E5
MNDTERIGTLHYEGDHGTVRMVELVDTDPDDLWAALTRPERLSRWIGDVEGDLRVGSELRAKFRSGWEGTLRVELCDAPRRLRVSSTPDDDDPTEMEAWLEPEGDRTRLTIEERGLAAAALHFHGAGWEVHVQDLVQVIAGRTPPEWEPRWRELIPVYEVMRDESGADENPQPPTGSGT